MVSSGFSNLGTELSGNGAGTKGLSILAYNKLNTTLTKDYFDPLQVGLIAGFSTSGTAGVNKFGGSHFCETSDHAVGRKLEIVVGVNNLQSYSFNSNMYCLPSSA